MTSDYFYIFFILISFTIMYIVTIYLQTLYAFKKDYSKYKCNPMMIPFSASFGESPVDVFNECLTVQQKSITDDYSSTLFSNLDSNNSNTSTINDISAGNVINQADFKNTLYGNSDSSSLGNNSSDLSDSSDSSDSSNSGTIPQLMTAQQNVTIATTKMVSKSKNIMDVIMANFKAILLTLESAPVMAKGIYRSPPIQLVKNIGALAGG